MVRSCKELENIDPACDAARISASVEKRKKDLMLEKTSELGIRPTGGHRDNRDHDRGHRDDRTQVLEKRLDVLLKSLADIGDDILDLFPERVLERAVAAGLPQGVGGYVAGLVALLDDGLEPLARLDDPPLRRRALRLGGAVVGLGAGALYGIRREIGRAHV